MGRLDAPLRRRDPLHGRLRHRRRPDASGHRGGHGDLPPQRPRAGVRGGDVPARRGHQRDRGLPRDPEPRIPVGPAHRLRRHQQPRRHEHARREGIGRARLLVQLGPGRCLSNNRVGMSTPVEKGSAEPELHKMAASYRFEGRRVDGEDPVVVRDAAHEALTQARENHRPYLLETMSYRLKGHSVVDPARYRTDEEREELAENDLLPRWRSRLIEDGVLTEQDAETIEQEATETIERAVEFADDSPAPEPEDLFTNAYSTGVANAPSAMPGDRVITL